MSSYALIPAGWIALLFGWLWLTSARRQRIRRVARPVTFFAIGLAIRLRLIDR